MYDVDPKWADLVKDRGVLPPPAHDVQKRMSSSSSSSMKNKSRSSNVITSSPSPSIPSVNTSQSIPTSLASSLPFPSLGALPPSLLSGLSGLGNYDPKNNPLLLPFGGMPNLGALSGLGNMNMTNMSNNLFANLAGLGLPSLGGMDPQALADATQASSQGGQGSKSKNRKSSSDVSNKNIPTSTANSMASQLPFFFPNPSLLYTPLGLGGLSPFPLPPGSMPNAYESLFNGGLPTTSSASSSSSSRHKSSTSTSRSSTVTTPASSRTSHPSQFDSHLLESLTRASRGLPDMSRTGSRGKAGDVESLRNLMSAIPPFAGMGADLTASSKKSREQEMKDAIDQFKSSAELFARIPQYSDEKGKPLSAADLVERHLKRPAMEMPPMDKPSKRIKDMSPISIPIPPVPAVSKIPPVSQHVEERLAPPPPPPHHTLSKEDNKTARSRTPQPSPTESTSNSNLSNSNELLPSLELTKKPPEPPPDEAEAPPVLPPVLEAPPPRPPPSSPTPPPPVLTQEDAPLPLPPQPTHSTEMAPPSTEPSEDQTSSSSSKLDDKEDSGGNKKGRKPRSKKSALPPIIDETVVERKNLRSSAGRAAAAAAARLARAAMQAEDSTDNAK